MSSLKLLALCFMMFLEGIVILSAQPPDGTRFPEVRLSKEEGQQHIWKVPPSGTTPVLMAYVHPDKDISFEALSGLLASGSISPTTYQRLLIYNTSASWKPDRLIKLSHRVKQLGNTLADAREDGIVQALMVKPQPSHNQWTPLYDWDATVNKTWKLPQEDVHVFLFSPDRQLIYYCKGPLTDQKNQTISQRLQQLVKSPG